MSSFSYGQKATKIRLLYHSADIQKPSDDTLNIKRVRRALNSDSVFVRLKNSKKMLLPTDKIWGFQDDDSIVYRNFEGAFYRVLQIDTLVMYSRKSGKYNHYYFSQSCDGKLMSINSENIKNVFAANECFINKMENGLKWYQDYSSYNDQTKTYRIIEFYKSCTEKTKASF